MEDLGEFKDNKQNGQGTFTGYNGDIYVGELKEGKFHGQGTLTHSNGDTYVGEFKDGYRNGQGTFTFSDGNRYIGEYKGGQKDGQGTMIWPDGSKYVGEWKDGDFNGHGTYTFADGGGYVGDWKNDQRNGHGSETQADGGVYVGAFKDDSYEGQGTLTHPNGTQEVGEFSEGVLINKMSFKDNFSIKSIVNSTDDGFAAKIEQINSMATEDVWSDLGLILHNRYMVKFLGGGNYSHTVFSAHEMLIAKQISTEVNDQLQCHYIVILKSLGKDLFMDLNREASIFADEVDDIVEADVRKGPDHSWTPTTIGRFYLSKLTTHINKLPFLPHLKTEADIQYEIQTIAEFTPEERGYNLGQTLVSLVSFMESDPRGKFPLFPNPVTPEQHTVMAFFMAHLFRLSYLGGMTLNSALEDSLNIFAEMVDEIAADEDRLDLGIKFVEKLSDR